jgi:small basic protein
MKIFVEFLVESINMIATSLMTSVPDVIMNYVALGSIGELDEIYYNSIRSPLKDELEERDFELPIKN